MGNIEQIAVRKLEEKAEHKTSTYGEVKKGLLGERR